jgi:glycosyltransferase involved in cell wall biosynthesis
LNRMRQANKIFPKKRTMTRDKIRVLHLVYQMGHGGIETFLISMLSTCDRDKFHMDIAYCGPNEGGYASDVRLLGSRLLQCKLGYDQLRFIYAFYKLLKREKIDAVNVHLADMSAGAIFAAWLARVPCRVASYHTGWWNRGFLRNFYMSVMRCIIKCTATAITTSSPAVTAEYFGRNSAVKNKIEAITYGCDTFAFAKPPKDILDLSTKGFGREHIIIGHVGSYRHQKNHEGLLKIIRGVIDKAPDARFVLCGASCAGNNAGDSYKHRIDSEIIRLGLGSYIAQVQGIADMRQFYHAIDIFVLPSRNEGMPISIIEAQAAGRPVVASNIDGIAIATAPELKNNLFEVDNIEGFVSCLVDLISDKTKRMSQGVSGQKFAQQYLDIRRAVEKYQNLYLPKN